MIATINNGVASPTAATNQRICWRSSPTDRRYRNTSAPTVERPTTRRRRPPTAKIGSSTFSSAGTPVGFWGTGPGEVDVDRSRAEDGSEEQDPFEDRDRDRDRLPSARGELPVGEEQEDPGDRERDEREDPVREPRREQDERVVVRSSREGVAQVFVREPSEEESDPDHHQEPPDRVPLGPAGDQRADRHVADDHHQRDAQEERILRERIRDARSA